MTFVNEEDYDEISQGDVLVLDDVIAQVRSKNNIVIKNVTKGKEIIANLDVSDRNREVLIAGGLLNYTSLSNR